MIQKKLEGMRGVEYVEKHPDQNELLWTKLGQYARTLQSMIATSHFFTSLLLASTKYLSRYINRRIWFELRRR